ncbi:MAG: Uma2 family endonuclease [Chloroflexi bacterium]|nr:Uma2 family endonuclease [Chloroflexota bacterium]
MGETVTRRRFTVDEYHCMGEAGILTEDDRVELIDGEIVEMAPIGGGHMWGVNLLVQSLGEQLRRRAYISTQNPVRLSRNDEPQPDLALIRRREGDPVSLPSPEDVFLVIEVADTSLRYDRQSKLPRYAAAGIPEAWLFDLEHARMEVHRDPGPNGYRTITIVERGGILSPLAFPDITIALDDVLP